MKKAVEPKPIPKQKASAEDELAAIRQGSKDFEKAFNAGDADAVSELWTEDGEYVDESGKNYSGRAEIAAAYGEFFNNNPEAKIQIHVDAVRLLSENTALEDGRAIVSPPPANAPGVGKYTAIHVKVDGQWLMSSVRDSSIETPSSYHHLSDLEWLVGTWTAEELGVKTTSVCRWVANKSFVERRYTITHTDGTKASGLQLIGWNPAVGHVQSWNFSPDGGHAVGVWSPHEGGWTAQIQGITGEGVATYAVNHLTRLDDNAYVWQSVNRTLGGQQLPDTGEVILKRQTDAQ